MATMNIQQLARMTLAVDEIFFIALRQGILVVKYLVSSALVQHSVVRQDSYYQFKFQM
jgi:hypothetical protein